MKEVKDLSGAEAIPKPRETGSDIRQLVPLAVAGPSRSANRKSFPHECYDTRTNRIKPTWDWKLRFGKARDHQEHCYPSHKTPEDTPGSAASIFSRSKRADGLCAPAANPHLPRSSRRTEFLPRRNIAFRWKGGLYRIRARGSTPRGQRACALEDQPRTLCMVDPISNQKRQSSG